jgi:glycosyltransferase involved in cell wall biosynthesis
VSGRLLVVAPHGTRTGSTRVLLGLLERLAPQLPVALAVEVRSGGPWAEDLRAFGSPLEPGERPVAALVNSSLAADAVLTLPAGVRSAVYVHEVGAALALLPDAARAGLCQADRVLVVSDAGAADVVACGVAPERVVVVPPLLVPAARSDAAAVARAREELGVPAGARLLIGCGEASERKGTDLFVEAVTHLRHLPDLHVAWIGRRVRAAARVLDHDVDACGLLDRISWIDDLSDPSPALAAADLLLMTSRVDPQPLVPLEAAHQGTATVAFDLGGLRDLGAAGAARTVAFPDTVALANAVVSLLDDPAERERLVGAAVARAAARQGPEVVVPSVLAELEALLAEGDGP